MILGMTPFTFFHVVLSLIGIFSGLVVVLGFMGGKGMPGWNVLFLVTTILTSVTGFMFPYRGFTPGIGLGIISLIVLAIALYARYSRHLAGGWRRTYVITSVLALYFNVFVLVAQLFEKVPSLHALAPTGSGPVFGVTQVSVIVLFIIIGIFSVKGFREPSMRVLDRSRAA